MSEKVLGFYKKDAWKFKQRHKSLIMDTWRVPCNKLVPVVSVEWLKNFNFDELYDALDKQCRGHVDYTSKMKLRLKEYLLSAVEKEAKK